MLLPGEFLILTGEEAEALYRWLKKDMTHEGVRKMIDAGVMDLYSKLQEWSRRDEP